MLLLLLIALLPVGSRALRAQTISVSGSPGLLRISVAIPGSEPAAVSNATSTYTVVTPKQGNATYSITGQLDAAMPPNVTLTASLAAPPRATSTGAIALDVVPRDLVTGIPKNTTATQAITYTLSATVAAGVIPASSRVVTFTVVQVP